MLVIVTFGGFIVTFGGSCCDVWGVYRDVWGASKMNCPQSDVTLTLWHVTDNLGAWED